MWEPGIVLIPMSQMELNSQPSRERARTGRRAIGHDVVLGEWTLERASWTDRHNHEELNYVIDGELHVTYDDETFVAKPGDVVIVPAGRRARYEAPVFARMSESGVRPNLAMQLLRDPERSREVGIHERHRSSPSHGSSRLYRIMTEASGHRGSSAVGIRIDETGATDGLR